MKPFAAKISHHHLFPHVLGISFFGFSFLLRWIALSQTDYGNGWDSYFYLVQLQSWQETGRMHSPEWTLLYPLLAFVDIFSPSHIITVKLVSALLAASFSAILFAMAWQMQNVRLVAIFVASFTLFSPELTYFAAQWPKNLLGVCLLLALCLALYRGNGKTILIFLLLGLFGHRMTALLGFFLFFLWLIRNHLSYKSIAGGLLLLGSIAAAGYLFPGILQIKDLERLQSLFATHAQFPVLSFYQLLNVSKISYYWHTELWLGVALLPLALFKLFRNTSPSHKQALAAVLILLFVLWMPFYHWEISGAAYRFFHVGVLLTPVLFILLSSEIKKAWLIGASLGLIILSFSSWKTYKPELHDPNYTGYASITQKSIAYFQELALTPELVIAQKSLAEFYTYTAHSDAMPWLPEYPIAPEKLWRIAYVPYPQLYRSYVRQEPIKLNMHYYLVPEHDWQFFIQELKEGEDSTWLDEHQTWQNPSQVRPSFLMKKR